MIQTKIEFIEDNLIKLEQLSPMSFEEFMADFRNLDSALHRFQTAIEAMIDICAHFVGRLRLGAPSESAGLIRALEKAGLLSKEHAEKYVDMVRFRNLVVHLYAEVDARQVYDILQNNLDDFRAFIADAWRIVQMKSVLS
jgi:uncharacterized protein YutE (UPF0331/DUF86 family)